MDGCLIARTTMSGLAVGLVASWILGCSSRPMLDDPVLLATPTSVVTSNAGETSFAVDETASFSPSSSSQEDVPDPDETESKKEPARNEPCEGPCLPLHTVEGVSGHFSVASAYFANPPAPGRVFGDPSVGFTYVNFGKGRSLNAFTATEVLWDRVELGYGLDIFEVGDFYEDVDTATGLRPHGHNVQLHNFNGRIMAVKEGDFGLKWMPAVTAGAHFKYNDSWIDIQRDLAPIGGLKALGIKDNAGWDFTLFASKTIPVGKIPFILTAGVRATEAAQIGLLGFTGKYRAVFEGAVCCMPLDRVVLAAEYRQKPDEYDTIPGLLGNEDDWWVLAAGYLLTNDFSIALGYGHFGDVLNHKANQSWGLALKYEF